MRNRDLEPFSALCAHYCDVQKFAKHATRCVLVHLARRLLSPSSDGLGHDSVVTFPGKKDTHAEMGTHTGEADRRRPDNGSDSDRGPLVGSSGSILASSHPKRACTQLGVTYAAK